MKLFSWQSTRTLLRSMWRILQQAE